MDSVTDPKGVKIMLTISNQPNFTGKAHFVGECSKISKAKIMKILEEAQLDKKTYDVFISDRAIMAKRNSFSSIAPSYTRIINQSKDSVEHALKCTLETFDNLLKHSNLL